MLLRHPRLPHFLEDQKQGLHQLTGHQERTAQLPHSPCRLTSSNRGGKISRTFLPVWDFAADLICQKLW